MERYLEISKEFNSISELALDLLIDKLYDLEAQGVEIKSPLNLEEIDGDYFDVKDTGTSIKVYIKEEDFILNKDKIDEVLGIYSVSVVEDEEKWLLAYQKYFKVFKPGKRFVIVPEWEDYEVEDGDLVITINPNMAFGTGTHPTTKNVLVLMEDLDFSGKDVVDIGSGSGILTIGAVLLGAKNVTVLDNDPKAIKVSKDNLNRYDNIDFKLNNLLNGIDKRYDIVLANIVAGVLIDLVANLGRNLKNGSYIIASGIIKEKWEAVDFSFKAKGLELIKIIEEEGWVTALYINR